MAAYPSVLPLPNWSYERRKSAGVAQSDLSSKPRQQRTSYDNEVRYNLTFELTKGQARLFRQWYVEQTNNGRQPFTIDLLDENGITTKSVRFAADGKPQPAVEQNVFFSYAATVVSRD